MGAGEYPEPDGRRGCEQHHEPKRPIQGVRERRGRRGGVLA